jgi:hypothetical protein
MRGKVGIKMARSTEVSQAFKDAQARKAAWKKAQELNAKHAQKLAGALPLFDAIAASRPESAPIYRAAFVQPDKGLTFKKLCAVARASEKFSHIPRQVWDAALAVV